MRNILLMPLMPYKRHGQRWHFERKLDYPQSQRGTQGPSQSQRGDAHHLGMRRQERYSHKMRHDEPNLSPMTDLLYGIAYQTRSLLAVVHSDVLKRKKLAEAKLLASHGMSFAYDSNKSLLEQCRPIEPTSGWQGQRKEP